MASSPAFVGGQLLSASAVPLAASRLASQPAHPGAKATSSGLALTSSLLVAAVFTGRKGKSSRSSKVVSKQQKSTIEINYYQMDSIVAHEILASVRRVVHVGSSIVGESASPQHRMVSLLSEPSVQETLITVSRLPVFSHEMGIAFKDDLDLLLALKQLKYFWNLPQSHVLILLKQLALQTVGAGKESSAFEAFLAELVETAEHRVTIKNFVKSLPAPISQPYLDNAVYLETADSHAVYPTSIYRQCDALTLATADASTIEAVMSTTLTTTIKITRKVLDPENLLLYNVYKPLGRCVAVVDDKVEKFYGAELEKYFAVHGITYVKLVFSGNEVDKDIRDVERILVALKKAGQARNEPLLVVGGGVIADVAGFAAALYSRNTPYVMLCTSIVSGIDAGPSPRVCCNGFDYKNLYGAYHPPVLTITDRGFWKTLHPGWIRHGVAEIIKMAVMKDLMLFELLEKFGPKSLP